MVDALVSAIVQQLAQVIDREIRQEVKLVVGVEKQVQNLTSLFDAIQAVLEDAERRQMKEAAIRNWLVKLKIWPMIWMMCWMSGEEYVILRHDIALKIKQVCDRVDAISKEAVLYNFRHTKEHEGGDILEPRRLSTSFIDVSRVCGRCHDKKNIVTKLLSQTNKEVGVHAISIVEMGGIGKTTLAQLAYNDDDVKIHFKKRIWVYVSDTFDEIRVAKAILESLNSNLFYKILLN
ncbi:hypothetical protein RCOM_1291250 [Ricinus communis]|uniref:NB-ARC domain-containing protein n=1 Tax=Ricinus communis TaxID=3988 RepID=B9SDS9_RICCO|nr:hypothetical protein RCOM_1291250 [Ricinus communis]